MILIFAAAALFSPTFSLSPFSLCPAPVHQMKEYYTYGTVDDCTGHWGKLTDCLKRKTEKYKEEAAIDPNASKHPLWQLRTGIEAKEFWRHEFSQGSKDTDSSKAYNSSGGYGGKQSGSAAAKGSAPDRSTMMRI